MTGYIIFDFDGTLADTSEGIVNTVQTTLDIMGLPQQPVAQIKATIGLPLSETIRLGGKVPEERVEEGVRIYREKFFSVAAEHIKLFPGVKETRLGATAVETIVVGDTTFDLLMGKGAGCRTCGVSYGNHDRATLASASPDFIVDSFPEIALRYPSLQEDA